MWCHKNHGMMTLENKPSRSRFLTHKELQCLPSGAPQQFGAFYSFSSSSDIFLIVLPCLYRKPQDFWMKPDPRKWLFHSIQRSRECEERVNQVLTLKSWEWQVGVKVQYSCLERWTILSNCPIDCAFLCRLISVHQCFERDVKYRHQIDDIALAHPS